MIATPRRALAAVAVTLATAALPVAAAAPALASDDVDVCTIIGTSERDVLRGTPDADVLCGYEGNDILIGYDGNDVLIGGPGRDTLVGGRGYDWLYGNEGADLLVDTASYSVQNGGVGRGDRCVGVAASRFVHCERIIAIPVPEGH